jgi:hypothetical protein
MKRTKVQRMLAMASGPALGMLLAVPVAGLMAGAAGADSTGGTCYTGCTTPTTGVNTAPADGPATTVSVSTTPTTSSGGLAFTGADIEEMAVIGVVAIGVGSVLVSRRRRTA